jgi:hypothetical protein
MRPRNELVRAEVKRIVDLKISQPKYRGQNYRLLAVTCGVKPDTIARYVCDELKKRDKSIIETFHVEHTDAKMRG